MYMISYKQTIWELKSPWKVGTVSFSDEINIVFIAQNCPESSVKGEGFVSNMKMIHGEFDCSFFEGFIEGLGSVM